MSAATLPDHLPSRDTVLGLSGLEFMLAALRGEIASSPISSLMNYVLDRVEPGLVVFRGTPEFRHANPMGATHGGWYGTILDSCMACAVMTLLPKGQIYTTLEYKVNLIRPIPFGVEVLATGHSDHAGRSTAVAHGDIRGALDGKLYATGSTTCLVMTP